MCKLNLTGRCCCAAILVQFGKWFNVKLSLEIGLTLNHSGGRWFNVKLSFGNGLTLNYLEIFAYVCKVSSGHLECIGLSVSTI